MSVRNRYGVGEGAGEYVQKFYDFLIPFEQRPEQRDASRAAAHLSRLLRTMLKGAGTNDGRDLIDTTCEFVSAYDLSLRQAERVAANILLAK